MVAGVSLFVNALWKGCEARETELQQFTNSVQRYGTMFEIYNAEGQPTKQCLCDSQPDFSEGAGMYLLCCDKKDTGIDFKKTSQQMNRGKRVTCFTVKEIIKT